MYRCAPLTALLLTAGLALVACQSGARTGHVQPVAEESIATVLGELPLRDLWLLGEQHDAAAHQAMQNELVRALARQERLAALVIEMADAGQSTAALARDADELRVREALGWGEERNGGGWPWASYGPVVMSAVRAGVPVLGGNLPRSRQRDAMADVALDGSLDNDSLARQQALVREGHCGLLPERQIAPMTRIQLARDRSMAEVAARAVKPGLTVLLVAGNEHVRRDLGVPRHLPAALPALVVQARSRPAGAAEATSSVGPAPQADRTWLSGPVPERDYCAELQKQLGR
jgi:uncharacterized iron-regulated protein